MLLENISSDELFFMEKWHDPYALSESLFPDFDNLANFDEDKLGEIRLYQMPMLSLESTIDEKMPGLKEKEQFELRKGVGDIYNFGARKFGKTMITEKLDIPLSMLHDAGWWCGFSSTDAIHLKGVLDTVKTAIDNHPLLKLWKVKLTESPNFLFVAKNGWKLEGINMNLQSKNPGHQWFGKHVKKLWVEEASFESEVVYNKRKDALSELGAVIRLSGMTNFVPQSPTGKVFYDAQNSAKIINLPQYVNPFWDEKERQSRIKEYGGVDSIGYRVFVKGEVVEDGVSEFDMQRVKKCYDEGAEIKSFEITKERYDYFKNLVVVERPKNAGRIFICADIGESAGTEIIILSEVDTKYNYLYNITLYNLTHDQQLEVFKYLIDKVNANVVALDCGEALGRTLCDSLEKLYKKDNIVRYQGQGKIDVDYERDEAGNVIMVSGKPQARQEYMAEWGVGRLKVLLYETRVNMPIDYKFDKQLASVISLISGTRTTYHCVSDNGDHMFDAWKVFAIAQWLKKDFNQTPAMKKEWGRAAGSGKTKEQKDEILKRCREIKTEDVKFGWIKPQQKENGGQ